MSIFALLAFVAAFICALVPVHKYVVAGLIALGVVLALVVTTGTLVTVH